MLMIRGWLCESVRRKVAVLDTVSTKLLSVSSKMFFLFVFSNAWEWEDARIQFFVLVGMVFHSGWSTTSKKSILVNESWHNRCYISYHINSLHVSTSKTQAASPQLPLMTWEVPYQQPLRALRCWMRPFAFRAFTNHAWMPEAFWMSLEGILFATILDV